MRDTILRKVSLLLLLVLALTACGGPPKDVKRQVEELELTISNVREEVNREQDEYGKMLNAEPYKFLQDYSPDERHEGAFKEAGTALDQAEKVRTEKIPAILDDYSDARQGELTTAITEVRDLTDSARSKAQEPEDWAKRVVEIQDSFEQKSTEALATAAATNTEFGSLKDETETAKQKFPDRADAISAKFEPFMKMNTLSDDARQTLQKEIDTGNPDYMKAATAIAVINENHTSLNDAAGDHRTALGQLSHSETHTLMDIKVDSEVEISRTSWDEGLDYPTENELEYPSKMVDTEAAEHFSQFGPDVVVANYASGWGSDDFKLADGVDRKHWDKLGIDPTKDWVKYDNTAEFYVGGVEDTYCHKLLMLQDGKPASKPGNNYCSQYDDASDMSKGIYWVEADELRYEDIGMDIYTKGAGDFADQATAEAVPPGMVYVGDNNYGEWQEDSNGNSFWVFYGQYRLFSDLIGGPRPYHYQSEYRDWNRNYRYSGTPYYASDGGKPRYGSSSPMAASRFANSSYVSSGLQDASARGAGPAARGGGPGGGGK